MRLKPKMLLRNMNVCKFSKIFLNTKFFKQLF